MFSGHDLEIRIVADDRFEVVAPRTLALVCFRHIGGNEQTHRLAEAINASGSAYVTPSVIGDLAFIRVSIGSTWTRKRHVDELWELIDTHAEAL